MLLNDKRPLKNLKIEVKDKEDLRKIHDLYKKNCDTQTEALIVVAELNNHQAKMEGMQAQILKKKKEIEELQKLIEKHAEDMPKLDAKAQEIEEDIQSTQEELFETLTEILVDNIDPNHRGEINAYIRKLGTFQGKDINHFVSLGLREGYDPDFIDSQITIKNPSPILTKTIMKEEYEARKERFRALKEKAMQLKEEGLEPKVVVGDNPVVVVEPDKEPEEPQED